MMSPEEMAARGRAVEAREAQQSFQRDCFIIPQESVERFLPDGITVNAHCDKNPILAQKFDFNLRFEKI